MWIDFFSERSRRWLIGLAHGRVLARHGAFSSGAACRFRETNPARQHQNTQTQPKNAQKPEKKPTPHQKNPKIKLSKVNNIVNFCQKVNNFRQKVNNFAQLFLTLTNFNQLGFNFN